MAYSEPSGYNVFIPSADATGYMISGFSRNVESYRVNRWMEKRPVNKGKGAFLRWKSEQAARARYGDMREHVWPEGGDRPSGQDNLELFEFEFYTTKRVAPSFTMGMKTIAQADWPLKEAQTQLIGSQLMLDRTLYGLNVLSGATWGLNQANVDGVAGTLGGNAALLPSGQNFTNGTAIVPNIKIALFAAVRAINKATLGQISFRDLIWLMSPDTAAAIAVSQEVNSVLSNSVWTRENIEHGGLGNPNVEFGLPPFVAGVEIVVDDSVQITSRKGAATLANQYALPLGTTYLLTRRKGDDVKPNSIEDRDPDDNVKENFFPVYSTVIGFFYEEMTVEAREDSWNRRIQGSVVSDFDIQLSNAKSGFQMLRCLG